MSTETKDMTVVGDSGSIGPRITTERSCFSCPACVSERYVAQGDSGSHVYCTAVDPRRHIGDTTWSTPEWCPALAVASTSSQSVSTKPERMTPEAFTDLCADLLNRGIANQDTRDVLAPLVGEAVRARSAEEQAGRERDEARRERWMADKERDAARMLAREVASELGEARAWAAKVEAASSDAQRELGTILFKGPDEKLDDAARRVVAERDALRADVELLKDRLVTLEAGRSGTIRLAEARALAAMRGWRQLPESVRGAVLTEASFLASAIEDYASAVEQDNLGAAERTKKAMDGRNV